MMRTRAVLFTAGVLLTGCGARADHFHPIDKGDVAQAMKDPPPTTTTTLPKPSSTVPATTAPPTTVPPTTAPPTTAPSEDVYLYFIEPDNQHVREVKERRTLPIAPIDALKDLQAVPKSDPTMKTLIPVGLVMDVKVDRSADVTLSADFGDRSPEERKLIGAQLTLTLTRLRGISLVRFVVNGATVTVPAQAERDDDIFRGHSDYSALVVK
jgi:spore germination protein GerM